MAGPLEGVNVVEIGQEIQGPHAARARTALALVDAMEAAGRERPTVDIALVALSAAIGVPRGGAVAIFAVGRSAGWIAHVLEQYSARFLIRPRAHYRPPPASQ